MSVKLLLFSRMLISAGGLSESDGQWHGKLSVNPVGFMKLWRYGVIRYLRGALNAGILKSDLTNWELKRLLAAQYERGWYVGVQEHISKKYFLGYAARYIRRHPIAQRRIRGIVGDSVKFETKDTKIKENVLDEMPKQKFIEALADHIPEHYRHAVRYYGLLSPRVKRQLFPVLFALLGQKRQPRPRRLLWAEMIRRYFGRDPLIDSRGKPLECMGRQFSAAA